MLYLLVTTFFLIFPRYFFPRDLSGAPSVNIHQPGSVHGEQGLVNSLLERRERHICLQEMEATVDSIILLHPLLNPLQVNFTTTKIKLIKVDIIQNCQIPKVGPASRVGPKLLNYLYQKMERTEFEE